MLRSIPRRWHLLILLMAITAPSQGQTFTKLADFDFSNGAQPSYETLVQNLDGKLYGTTYLGGRSGGTVFAITPQGHLTTQIAFHGKAGANPYGSLLATATGELYGTTTGGGGDSPYGMVYQI